MATEAAAVKITVVKSFRDKNDTSIRYGIGVELEFDEARAKDIVDRGLGAYVEPIA